MIRKFFLDDNRCIDNNNTDNNNTDNNNDWLFNHRKQSEKKTDT